ncbi:2Fe-2S iron-sulfur cluster-binding protein [Streptomyces pratensis]|uniref:2Fe-2S iron-sulfur cluster-binding protein n=1 Tax=Streptomyces pratensis TaxID=1169025 RepID=UPI0030174376
MTNEEHADQQGRSGGPDPQYGGWEPTPQSGDYDADATAFVHLPPEDLANVPLAAPGQGYVPPMILPLTPAAGLDPAATGSWVLQTQSQQAQAELRAQEAAGQEPEAQEPDAVHWPDPNQQGGYGGPYQNTAHATAQWNFSQPLGDVPQDPQADRHTAPADPPEATGPYGDHRAGHAEHPGQADHAGHPGYGGYAEHSGHSDHVSHPGHTGQGSPSVYGDHADHVDQRDRYGHGDRAGEGGHLGHGSHPDQSDHGHHGSPFAPVDHSGHAGHTGQWTIPVADGSLPDESGEFLASAHTPQWYPEPQPPATLPGGAPAPWATSEPEPDRVQAETGRAQEPDRAQETDPSPGPEPEEAPQAPPAPSEEPEEPTGPTEPVGSTTAPPTEDAARHAIEDATEHATEDSFERAAGPAEEPAPDQQTEPAAERTADPAGDPMVGQAADRAADVEAADIEGARAPETAAAPEPGTAPEAALDVTAVPVDVPSVHPSASYVLHVNGMDRPVSDAWIGESLLYVLRERLGLAGAKDGCSQGECGACNVQVDGRLVASCLVPAATTAGSEVRTVEGLAVDGEPSDVQRALAACGAVQCGFCIPGMAMTVHDLLEGNHAPSELETRQALCGNLCRCSGYRGVLDAVADVVAAREANAEAAAPSQGEARIPHQAAPGAGGVQQRPEPKEGDAR